MASDGWFTKVSVAAIGTLTKWLMWRDSGSVLFVTATAKKDKTSFAADLIIDKRVLIARRQYVLDTSHIASLAMSQCWFAYVIVNKANEQLRR